VGHKVSGFTSGFFTTCTGLLRERVPMCSRIARYHDVPFARGITRHYSPILGCCTIRTEAAGMPTQESTFIEFSLYLKTITTASGWSNTCFSTTVKLLSIASTIFTYLSLPFHILTMKTPPSFRCFE